MTIAAVGITRSQRATGLVRPGPNDLDSERDGGSADPWVIVCGQWVETHPPGGGTRGEDGGGDVRRYGASTPAPWGASPVAEMRAYSGRMPNARARATAWVRLTEPSFANAPLMCDL